MKILVVEDEKQIRRLTERFLNIKGHEVVVAENGRVALESFTACDGDFDLIITDQNMPELDGLALMEHIHQIDDTIPVILMVGRLEQQVRELEQQGRCRVLQKPFRSTALLSMVSEVEQN